MTSFLNDINVEKICKDILRHQFYLDDDYWWEIYTKNLQIMIEDIKNDPKKEDLKTIYLRVLNGRENPVDIKKTLIDFFLKLKEFGYNIPKEEWEKRSRKCISIIDEEMTKASYRKVGHA